MRDSMKPTRDDEARAYLANARRYADGLNEVLRGVDPLDMEASDLARAAEANAIVAIALVKVPQPPGSRLA